MVIIIYLEQLVFWAVFSFWLLSGLKYSVPMKNGGSSMQIACGKCEFYYVTHDKTRPWGCRNSISNLRSYHRKSEAFNWHGLCLLFQKIVNSTSEKRS